MSVADEILSSVRTVGDAADALRHVFSMQMDKADDENADANTSVVGDSVAREAFLTILPVPDQRMFFLNMVKTSRFWPRIRTLVGSPPFPFLQEQDDEVLRASGITPGRAHMANVNTHGISSYSSFGSAQFEDGSSRDFKVIRKVSEIPALSAHARRLQDLPYIGLVSGDGVVMEVRLKKRSLKMKIEIARGRTQFSRDAVAFPRSGTVLDLRPSRRLRGSSMGLRVFVNSVQPRAAETNVARILCKVI